MFRTQIYLTEYERDMLLLLSKEMGLHQSALIREAIDQFIEKKQIAKKNKIDSVRAAAGLWVDRNVLPDFADIRNESDK